MGTHVVEAGFPVNSDAEFEAVRDIAAASHTTVCGLARVVEEDIEAALDSGVDLVHVFVSTSDVQINGIGERAGNAAYEEVVMALESLYNVDTGTDTTAIAEVSRVIEEKSDVPVPGNKPVVGDNAFSHESGIHAAGVIENSDTFEPGVMTPEMVGAERELVLGKHTGQHSVRERLEEAGYDPTDDDVREVTRRVKDFGAEAQRVTVDELEKFAREVGVEQAEEEVRA